MEKEGEMQMSCIELKSIESAFRIMFDHVLCAMMKTPHSKKEEKKRLMSMGYVHVNAC